MKKLVSAALAGDVISQYELGLIHARGDGVPTADYTKAAKWFNKAANQGHARAMYHLGLAYNNGLLYSNSFCNPLPKDQELGLEWLKKAASEGDPDAQSLLAGLCESGSPLSIELYRISANQGNINSQYKYGMLYATGQGVKQDFAEAFKWFLKAAEQGYDLAQNAVANAYIKGEGVTQDYAKAAQWFLEAACQGHAHSLCALGIAYLTGAGVVERKKLAFALFYIVSNIEDEFQKKHIGIANKFLSNLEDDLSENEIEDAIGISNLISEDDEILRGIFYDNL